MSILLLFIALLTLACGTAAPQPGETAAPVETPAVLEETETVDVIVEVQSAAPAATVPPTPSPTPTAAPTDTPSPMPTPAPLDGIVIGIDPGHQLVYNPNPEPVAPGSKQTKQKVAGGCRGVNSGVFEYDVAQSVGLYLKALLEEQGATVWITHETVDVNISNVERAQFFNEHNVDIGIRLHCNKADDRKICGAFMLIPTQNRTKFYDFNRRAAETVLNAYLAETGLPMRYENRYHGITERSDQTGFNWCERPIINIEMGHLTNPEEDALISTDEFQQKMAQGLCNGFVEFFTAERAAATP